MKEETFNTNILTLAVAGLLILITGISFFYFRDFFSRYIRFFLPIPPLAVAAYIYVYNMFEYFQGKLPGGSLETVKEIGISIGISTAFFSTFTILMVLLISLAKRFLG